jgi:hypothetical protein
MLYGDISNLNSNGLSAVFHLQKKFDFLYFINTMLWLLNLYKNIFLNLFVPKTFQNFESIFQIIYITKKRIWQNQLKLLLSFKSTDDKLTQHLLYDLLLDNTEYLLLNLQKDLTMKQKIEWE